VTDTNGDIVVTVESQVLPLREKAFDRLFADTERVLVKPKTQSNSADVDEVHLVLIAGVPTHPGLVCNEMKPPVKTPSSYS